MVKVQFDWDYTDYPLFYSPEGVPVDAPYEREHWPDIVPLISEELVEDLGVWARQMCDVYTVDAAVRGALEVSYGTDCHYQHIAISLYV